MTISILERAAAAITTDNANHLRSVAKSLVVMISKEIRENEYSEKTFARPLLSVAKALAKHDVAAAVNAACFAIYEVAPQSDSLRLAAETILQNVDALAAQDRVAADEAARIAADGIEQGNFGKDTTPAWVRLMTNHAAAGWTKHIDALAEHDFTAAMHAAEKGASTFGEQADQKWLGYLDTIAARDLVAAINIANALSWREDGDLAESFLQKYSPRSVRRPPCTSAVSEKTSSAISAFINQFG